LVTPEHEAVPIENTAKLEAIRISGDELQLAGGDALGCGL